MIEKLMNDADQGSSADESFMNIDQVLNPEERSSPY